jgi:cytoskeletal protein CcmA (bactofilin family)
LKGLNHQTTSLVSEDLEIDGNIHCLGEVIIQGKIRGNVRGHLVTVGSTGHVFGEVEADDLIIDGQIQGPVLSVKLLVSSTANIIGNIYYRILQIEFGANVAGFLTRTQATNSYNANRVEEK